MMGPILIERQIELIEQEMYYGFKGGDIGSDRDPEEEYAAVRVLEPTPEPVAASPPERED